MRKKFAQLDLTGQRFGRLVAIQKTFREGCGGNTYWLCQCDCGTEKLVLPNHLRRETTRSCGCLHRERSRKAQTTHGQTYTPEFRAWTNMKVRCHHEKDPAYPRYGGRGITVCERWKDSFENFIADVGPKPSPKHSIGRINNDGNYEPGNVRWETHLEQKNNRCNNRRIVLHGREQTLAEWCREFRVDYPLVASRFYALGWPIERALTEPSQRRFRKP